MTATLSIDLGDRRYPIHIGAGLLTQAALYQPHLTGRRVLIVTNETVGPLYLEALRQTLAGFTAVETLILPDGERFKNLETWSRIFDHLLEHRFDRQSALVALGGGVIGDITGFASACYQRGIAFVQVPTTLLAQVDSSVGGKTGVNHPRGKNMIGAFYQPKVVVADTQTLDTLPDRELSAGLAEVIKYGLIRDRPFFEWLESYMDSLRARDPVALAEAIERSCRNKAAVVEADEQEAGQRALLNFGHTFGHAIETGMGYGVWLHGEAVGAGMCLAMDMSRRLGCLSADQATRGRALIERAGLSGNPPAGLSPQQFLSLMAVDKKVQAGQIRLVLLDGIGQARVTPTFDPAVLHATLSAHCHDQKAR
ncbi:MAG: 3-dehydroquinate synthase [Pseudomonadota bacterium]